MMNKAIKISRTVLEGVTIARVMPSAVRAKWLVSRINDMGPTYVKMGQFLSSRADILGPDAISALKTLQDSSNPLDWDTIKGVISRNSATDLFSSVDQIPIASASIGQVHRAQLLDGSNVVLKVRRPGIVDEVRDDMAILEGLVNILSLVTGPSKMDDTRRVISDLKMMILNETDFEREVQNMRVMSKSYPDIVVPYPYPDMCSSDMIVMQYVPSSKMSSSVKRRSELAYALMDTFVQQFLQYGLIHGDPHEGNFALSSFEDDALAVFVMYDLGHVVKLDSGQRTLMKILVFEIMTENVDGVIDAMEKMPEIIRIRDKDQTRQFVKRYIEYIKTIDIQVLSSLDSRQDTLPIEFSSTVFEIVRVFGIVEGICLTLDPDFKYEKVFYKYVDTLVMDRDFLEYKARKDLVNIMKWLL